MAKGGNDSYESQIDKLVRVTDKLIFQYLTNIAVSLLTTLVVLKMFR
jgi:hypothetical protein